MTTKTKHTPTPWVTEHSYVYSAGNGDNALIASTGTKRPTATDHANCRHIVKCVNNFVELLSVLKAMTNLAEYYEPPDNFNDEEKRAVKEARSVIARVEKGE